MKTGQKLFALFLTVVLGLTNEIPFCYAAEPIDSNDRAAEIVSALEGESVSEDGISENSVGAEAVTVKNIEELLAAFPARVSGTTATITIDRDVVLNGGLYFQNLSYDTIILMPNGKRTIHFWDLNDNSSYHPEISVTGKTLKLGDTAMGSGNLLTLDGGAQLSVSSDRKILNNGRSSIANPISCHATGTLEIYDGVTIQNFYFPQTDVMIVNEGTLRMKGGLITKNYLTGDNLLTLGTQGLLCNDNMGSAPLMEISGGTIIDNFTEERCIGNTAGATLKISGGLIQSAAKNYGEWFYQNPLRTGIDNAGELIISDGTIRDFANQVYSWNRQGTNSLKITGGILSGDYVETTDGKVKGESGTILEVNSGTADISGGVLENGSTGIGAANQTVVNLTGGTIRKTAAGIYLNEKAAVNMSGGMLDHIYGYGVHLDGGTFALSKDGVIRNCIQNGIFNERYGLVTMSGGTIENCGTTESGSGYMFTYGGGIRNYGNCRILGGTIQNCKANLGGGISNEVKYQDLGDGLKILDGKLTMTGGTIQNCKASLGGGGIVNYGVFDLQGGILQKNSSDMTGGGIENGGLRETEYENRAVMTMEGGTIQENFAGYYGGAVFNYRKAALKGGSLLNNKAGDSCPAVGMAKTAETVIGENLVQKGNSVSKKNDTIVKASIKQLKKVNLFYTDGEGLAQLTLSNGEIADVELTNASECDFSCTINRENGQLTISSNASIPIKSNGTVDTKKLRNVMKLKVSLEDGRTTDVSLKVGTEYKIPKLCLNPTAIYLCPQWNNQDTDAAIYNKTDKSRENASDFTILKSLSEQTEVKPASDGMVNIKYSNQKNCTAKLEIQKANWRKKQVLSYSIRIKTPKAVLSQKKVILNTTALGASANRIALTLTGNNKLELSANQILPSNSKTRLAVSQNQIFVISDERGQLTVGLGENGTAANLKNGTYKFRIIPQVRDGGELHALAGLSFSIVVTNKKPAVKLSGKGIVYLTNAENLSKSTYTTKLSNMTAEVVGAEISNDAAGAFDVAYLENGKFAVKIKDVQKVVKNQRYKLYPKFYLNNGITITAEKPITITVK